MIETITEMFSYTFMVHAVVAGLFLSLCSSLLGVSLVLKRYSMIGDGLSHIGFGALAVASAANLAPLGVALPVVVLAAILLLRLNGSGRLKGDSTSRSFPPRRWLSACSPCRWAAGRTSTSTAICSVRSCRFRSRTCT